MPFKSDKQRKGFFGNRGGSQSNNQPSFSTKRNDPATSKTTNSRVQRVDNKDSSNWKTYPKTDYALYRAENKKKEHRTK